MRATTDNMPLCILCERTLADESPEHVILNAFGGRKTTTQVLCTTCNHRLGDEVDKPFAEAFDFIRNLANVQTGDGDAPPTLRNVKLADGTVIDLLPGYKPREKRVVYLRGNGDAKIGVASIETLLTQLDNFAKGLQLTREEFLAKLTSAQAEVRSRHIPDKIPWNLSFGGRAQERSVTKSALVLWTLHTSNDEVRGAAYERARAFASKGGVVPPAPPVAWLTFASLPIALPPDYPASQFSHALCVWSDGGGRVVGYYRLFGQFGFAVRLAEATSRPRSGIALLVNPTTRQWSCEPLDASAVPPCSAIDAMATRHEEGNAAFHRLMTDCMAKHQQEFQDELLQKSMNRALPGEGELIEERHIKALAHDVAERVVSRIYGGTSTAPLTGEKLVEELRRLLAEAEAAEEGT